MGLNRGVSSSLKGSNRGKQPSPIGFVFTVLVSFAYLLSSADALVSTQRRGGVGPEPRRSGQTWQRLSRARRRAASTTG